jgi:hypothetical protein
MTSDEIKSAITDWCSQGRGLQLVEDRSEAGADFVLGLRAGAPGSIGTVPIDARLDQGGDRVTITSTPTAGAAERVKELLDSRPATVHAEAGSGGTMLAGHVYTDGFSRQSFMAVVEEVAKTRGLVDALAAGAGAAVTGGDELGGQPVAASESSTQHQPWAARSTDSQEQPAAAAGSTPSSLPQPSFGGASSQPQPGFGAASSQPAYSPLGGQPAQQPHPASTAFAPTHTVPPQGMQSWAAPDPNGAIVATLGGGLPIQVTEVRGAWANVLCSNGWSGWVDGRIIGVAR